MIIGLIENRFGDWVEIDWKLCNWANLFLKCKLSFQDLNIIYSVFLNTTILRHTVVLQIKNFCLYSNPIARSKISQSLKE